ncbi:MAG: SPFH/Band 7/PHB domain protein [Chloroflexi bacterium]|nr:MAG: SPFH/Band 7/PHB domain protein [Chloroflexota bacterium]
MRRKKELVAKFDDAREDGLFMSPESEDPNSTWQTPSLHWQGTDEDILPLSNEQDEAEDVNADQLSYLSDNNGETDQLPDDSSRFDTLKKIGQQISPIVTPLLFGGITFLFLLPLMSSGQFYLHTDRIWPVGLVIVAVMILQGMMLYYAGANNVYWTLGIVGGFFLFLLVGCFVLFGPFSTLVLLVVLLIVSIIAARFSMHQVEEGSVDIVYAFGKYSRTLFPGLNFMLPWEKVFAHLQTKERQWTCPEQTAPVSRDEDVHFKAMICYQLMPEDAHLAVLQVEKWEEALQELFKTVLQNVAGHLKPSDFLAWPDKSRLHQSSDGSLRLSNPEVEEATHWEHINLLLAQEMQDRVAAWGVMMNWVYIRDVTLTPRVPVHTDAMINMNVAKAGTPPVQAQVQRARPAGLPVTPAAPGTKHPKEEVLKNAYKQIQSGAITSPDVIRSIAANFQAIANDPEASQNVSFDAAQAARTLYDRAKLIQEQESVASPVMSTSTPPVSGARAPRAGMPAQSGWSYRAPSDDNLTAGG